MRSPGRDTVASSAELEAIRERMQETLRQLDALIEGRRHLTVVPSPLVAAARRLDED
jgi:hypothetical protein